MILDPRRAHFLDTSAIVALEDVGDEHHAAAKEFARRIARDGLLLVTTNFILDESYTWFCAQYDARMRVCEGLLRSPRVRYLRLEEEDETEALTLGRQHRDKDYSFTDLTSFVVMLRLGLKRAFTFDRHFRQFGKFTMVP